MTQEFWVKTTKEICVNLTHNPCSRDDLVGVSQKKLTHTPVVMAHFLSRNNLRLWVKISQKYVSFWLKKCAILTHNCGTHIPEKPIIDVKPRFPHLPQNASCTRTPSWAAAPVAPAGTLRALCTKQEKQANNEDLHVPFHVSINTSKQIRAPGGGYSLIMKYGDVPPMIEDANPFSDQNNKIATRFQTKPITFFYIKLIPASFYPLIRIHICNFI